MNHYKLFTLSLMVACLPAAAWAQGNTSSNASQGFGPIAGEGEITLGGSGASDKDFDDSFGGLNGSLGFYLNDTLMWSVRQSLNYSDPDVGGNQWNGATRIAIDQHFATADSPLRPFVGANFGRIYGDSVNDTWAAGLEAGAKYYVQPKTFVYATAEYDWLFKSASNLDDTFDDGSIFWSVGIGFNF